MYRMHLAAYATIYVICICICIFVYHRWARNSVKHESDIAFKIYLSLIEDRFLYCFMILIALEISLKSLGAICKMLNQIWRNFAIDKLSKLLPGWILYSPVFYITFNALNDNAQWDTYGFKEFFFVEYCFLVLLKTKCIPYHSLYDELLYIGAHLCGINSEIVPFLSSSLALHAPSAIYLRQS